MRHAPWHVHLPSSCSDLLCAAHCAVFPSPRPPSPLFVRASAAACAHAHTYRNQRMSKCFIMHARLDWCEQLGLSPDQTACGGQCLG